MTYDCLNLLSTGRQDKQLCVKMRYEVASKLLVVLILSSLLMLLVLLRERDFTMPSAIMSRIKEHINKIQELAKYEDEVQVIPSYYESFSEKDLPTIYMVTPTYRRAEQIPELTRTGQTLLHVPNLVWIVAEDAPSPSKEVLDYLEGSRFKYVYLRAQMPEKFRDKHNKPRGVSNRNAGIEWIRKNATDGVVYFGDDDNTYDIRIFEEIRYTKKVSMFPVGLIGKLGVSTPIVREGRVVGFYDGWIGNRKFAVDMAGFAINVQLFLDHPEVLMPYTVGYEEDGILRALQVQIEDIEPKAENCTKILVWHTKTKKNLAVKDGDIKNEHKDTNLVEIRRTVWRGV